MTYWRGDILGVTYWRGDILGVTYWRDEILGVTYWSGDILGSYIPWLYFITTISRLIISAG